MTWSDALGHDINHFFMFLEVFNTPLPFILFLMETIDSLISVDQVSYQVFLGAFLVGPLYKAILWAMRLTLALRNPILLSQNAIMLRTFMLGGIFTWLLRDGRTPVLEFFLQLNLGIQSLSGSTILAFWDEIILIWDAVLFMLSLASMVERRPHNHSWGNDQQSLSLSHISDRMDVGRMSLVATRISSSDN